MTQMRALAVALTLAGCASAPVRTDSAAHSIDPRAVALQQALDESIASGPSLLRRSYSAQVVGVRDRGATILIDVDVERAASFGRPAHTFSLLVACDAGAPDDCNRKAIDAVRGVAAVE